MKIQQLFEAKNNLVPDYQAWLETKRSTGQPVFSRDFQKETGAKWYYVVKMDPNTKNSYLEDEPYLLATDDVGEAHGFAYNLHKKDGGDYGVYTPNNDGFNGRYHKQPHDGQPRAKNGRFGQRPKKEEA